MQSILEIAVTDSWKEQDMWCNMIIHHHAFITIEKGREGKILTTIIATCTVVESVGEHDVAQIATSTASTE